MNHRARVAGRLWPILLALSTLGGAVRAEQQTQGVTYSRVRFFEPGLTVESPAGEVPAQAVVNVPILPGDSLSTADGRAEIEMADSSLLWIDHDTRLELPTLADGSSRIERTNLLVVESGSVRIEARDPMDADAVFQVDTEAGSVYLLSAGSFRIDVSGGFTTVSSFGGVAEFSGDRGSILVRGGQRSTTQSGRAPAEPRRFNTDRGDDFDRFHDDRRAAYSGSSVEADVTLLPAEIRPYAEELSYYGTWETVPSFGQVWKPRATGVFSPYEQGSWGWYPAGWVWISKEAWGWAPYHFGRWDFLPSTGWFWMPGSVWSGAWVTFALAPDYVGWCPLNYWNQPAFHDGWIDGAMTVSVGRLDPRGWQFAPVTRFGLRAGEPTVVRGDRPPRSAAFLVTQSLPKFDPSAIAKHPEIATALIDLARRTRLAPSVGRGPGGEPVSFRVQERELRRLRNPSWEHGATRGLQRGERRPTNAGTMSRPASGWAASRGEPLAAMADPGRGPGPSRPPRESGPPVAFPGRLADQPSAGPSSATGTRPGDHQTSARRGNPRPESVTRPDPADGTGGRAVERLVGGTRSSASPPCPAPVARPAPVQRPTSARPGAGGSPSRPRPEAQSRSDHGPTEDTKPKQGGH